MIKVRITKLPQARTGYQVQGSLANDVPAMGGADYNTYIGQPKLKSSKYMTAVPREEANLEAEGGETVYGDINGDGMAEHKIIKGPRHSNGGVPLNLPDDTFIYSDFKGMSIKEPELLTMFGKDSKGKKSFTPAQLAKQYDIEKYRKILQDPNSDSIDKKTAELMIKNYQNKLGMLAIVQEGKKGFPQGIAKVSQPTVQENKYSEESFLDPSVAQFSKQIEGKLAEDETANSNTELQDEAQAMNQGQPVAMPQQPMAQYGMTMGGYAMPFADSIPQAEYGMAMGANPRNYMGRNSSSMYARGGALNRYQTQGEVKEREKVDITGKTPAEIRRIRWNNKGKDVDYMKDGKKQKYNAPKGETFDGKDLTQLAKINRAQEAMLEETLKDPTVRKKLWEATLKQVNDKSSYSNGKVDSAMEKAIKDGTLSEETIGKIMLDQTRRANKLKETGVNTAMFTNSGDKLKSADDLVKAGVFTDVKEAQAEIDKYKKQEWTSLGAVQGKAGITVAPKGGSLDVKLAQAVGRGYVQLNNDFRSGMYDKNPDEAFALENMLGDPKDNTGGKFMYHTGDADETAGGKPFAQTSPIDGFEGNTTAAQSYGIANNQGEFVDDEQPKTEDGTVIDQPEEKDETVVQPTQEDAPFWLQDKIKIAGAAMDLFSAKKYMPMGAARVDLQTPKPTFMDPTRELAANAEQANIQTAGMAQFAGPQALSARSSSIQGQGAKNAADVMAKYNNANVNIANQFETNIANINNQEAAMNQANQAKLSDDIIRANQNMDNTDRALTNNLINQTVSGITNAAKTQGMNTMYPQYKTDTRTGGRITFDPTQAKQFDGQTSGDNENDYYEECKKRYKDEATIQKCVDSKIKNSASSGGDSGLSADAKSAILNQYPATENLSLKMGGFMYSDITFPFIF